MDCRHTVTQQDQDSHKIQNSISILFLSLHFIWCTTYDKDSVSIYMHLHFISPVAVSANMTSLHLEHENTPITLN